jgi:hypothetical protein
LQLKTEVSEWKKKGVRILQEDPGSFVFMDTEGILGTVVELFREDLKTVI